MTYHGSCHCGAVTFEVEAEFTEGISCNCSHCKRKGMLLAFGQSGDTMAINLNCLVDLDTDSLTINKVDGKNF